MTLSFMIHKSRIPWVLCVVDQDYVTPLRSLMYVRLWLCCVVWSLLGAGIPKCYTSASRIRGYSCMRLLLDKHKFAAHHDGAVEVQTTTVNGLTILFGSIQWRCALKCSPPGQFWNKVTLEMTSLLGGSTIWYFHSIRMWLSLVVTIVWAKYHQNDRCDSWNMITKTSIVVTALGEMDEIHRALENDSCAVLQEMGQDVHLTLGKMHLGIGSVVNWTIQTLQSLMK